MKTLIAFKMVILILCCHSLSAQSPEQLVKLVKQKIDQVDNYVAEGRMKTNVSFLKVPEANVKVYFKKPGKIKIVNEQGISLVPKGAISFSLNTVLSLNDYQVIDAGTDKVNGYPVRVIKMIPTTDQSEIVLSTLYVDVAKQIVLKAKTTTRDNGTYELLLSYGKYLSLALPENVTFSFNTKEYKLPKGITFDYDDGTEKKKPSATANQNKGEVKIHYRNYIINKGVKDAIFQ